MGNIAAISNCVPFLSMIFSQISFCFTIAIPHFRRNIRINKSEKFGGIRGQWRAGIAVWVSWHPRCRPSSASEKLYHGQLERCALRIKAAVAPFGGKIEVAVAYLPPPLRYYFHIFLSYSLGKAKAATQSKTSPITLESGRADICSLGREREGSMPCRWRFWEFGETADPGW